MFKGQRALNPNFTRRQFSKPIFYPKSKISTSMDNVNNFTIGDLLNNYPLDGVNVSITFTRKDLADLMNLWISLDDSDKRLGILDHIITQIYHKKNS